MANNVKMNNHVQANKFYGEITRENETVQYTPKTEISNEWGGGDIK